MSALAQARLQEERKLWRKDHPHGFMARPTTNINGSLNIFKWETVVPGKPGTA